MFKGFDKCVWVCVCCPNSLLGHEPSALDTVEGFHPQRKKWERLAPMNSPRCSASSIVIRDRLLVVGGVNQVHRGSLLQLHTFYTVKCRVLVVLLTDDRWSLLQLNQSLPFFLVSLLVLEQWFQGVSGANKMHLTMNLKIFYLFFQNTLGPPWGTWGVALVTAFIPIFIA